MHDVINGFYSEFHRLVVVLCVTISDHLLNTFGSKIIELRGQSLWNQAKDSLKIKQYVENQCNIKSYLTSNATSRELCSTVLMDHFISYITLKL